MGMGQTPFFIEIFLDCLPELRSPPHLCLLHLGPGPLYSKTVLGPSTQRQWWKITPLPALAAAPVGCHDPLCHHSPTWKKSPPAPTC